MTTVRPQCSEFGERLTPSVSWRATVAPERLSAMVAGTTGRDVSLFQPDIDANADAVRASIQGKKILVTGAAGSIGSATIRQIMPFRPALLVAVDLSENGLVELVRDLRSGSVAIADRSLRTFAIDFGSDLCGQMIRETGPFDLVLHFAAMKHVRSERDIYSLSRLMQTNVLKVDRFLTQLKMHSPCDVFAVSTDKACAPANLMGASKRLMEHVVFWHGHHPGRLTGNPSGEGTSLPRAACTRFANVAFSDGSLLEGFLYRIQHRQPLAGPSDVRRFFISEQEAGQICLLTAALAENGQNFVPRMDPDIELKGFDEIAEIVLREFGYEPRFYEDGDEAKAHIDGDITDGAYPCCFAPSDTSGEKSFEEFIGPDESLAPSNYSSIQVIAKASGPSTDELRGLLAALSAITESPDPICSKERLVELLTRAVSTFQHIERDRDLDQQM